jgi:hypothetical protein
MKNENANELLLLIQKLFLIINPRNMININEVITRLRNNFIKKLSLRC